MSRRFALFLALIAVLVQPLGLGAARMQSWVDHAMVHASAVDHGHGDELALDEAATAESVFHLHPEAGAAGAPPPEPVRSLGQRPVSAPPAWVAFDIPSPDPARLLRPPRSLS
jgi:hypothetical protein